MANCLYLFLDEGGDFGFSNNGSRYFSLTCAAMQRDFSINHDLDKYKYDVIEFCKDLDRFDRFHCADDNAHVKNRVFGIIQEHLPSINLDSAIVRKCKSNPTFRKPHDLYALMLGYLIKRVLNHYDLSVVEEVIVITDRLPQKKKKEAFQKAIKQRLANVLQDGTRYRVLHHYSGSHYGIQVADYCNWAIFRKWEKDDDAYHQKIKPAIKSESELDIREFTTPFYDDGTSL